MLVSSVPSQQSEQKEQSSLHATCGLFSADQFQPGMEGREGRKRMSIAQGKRDQRKGKVRMGKAKEKGKGSKKKKKEIKDTIKHSTGT